MDDKLKPPFLHNHEHQSSNITLVNASIEEASKQEAYSIFSKKEKYVIVMIASFTAFISPLSANIYLPALDAIQKVFFFFKKNSILIS
jgi:hypothetical protein